MLSRGMGIRMCGYHDALPRQILVHKDMVSWETPKKAEVRHFVHVALKPWRESLRDHPPGMGEPTCRVQWRFEGSQSKVLESGTPLKIFQWLEASLSTEFWRLPLDLSEVSFKALGS